MDLFHRYLRSGVLIRKVRCVTRTAANRESDWLPFPFLEVAMAHPEWSADKVRGGEIELRQSCMGGLFGTVGVASDR